MAATGTVTIDIARTQGALLLGGLFSAGLSGMVAIQVIVYLKLYPSDPSFIKSLVLAVWCLDMVHTGLTWAAIWEYLIVYYGNATTVDSIPLYLSLTIVFTATLTLLVQCFFAHRIHLLSKGNWYITSLIVLLAIGRLCSAFATSAEMIHAQSFSEQWLFSFGLALSSTVDILITLFLSLMLQNSRSSSLTLDHAIDTLILYTFEIGSLTCAATIVSMLCWLTMNNNLIFMGLHFVISKLYANSLLATLNTRYGLRNSQSTHEFSPQPDIRSSRHRTMRLRDPLDSALSGNNTQVSPVHINIEKSVEFVFDSEHV